MKEFSAQTLIENNEFRKLFMEIIFFSNKENILDLIRRFDEFYSQALEINTTQIDYTDTDYSYYKKQGIEIHISKTILENDGFRENMLETYLHEKRHNIQYMAAMTNDRTFFKEDFKYITISFFETPITNKSYYDFCHFANLINYYAALPHEEDAFYNSNLQLIELGKELIKYNKANKIKIDKNKLKQLRSIHKKCERILRLYDLNFYEEYKIAYAFSANKFYKQLKKERNYVKKIKSNIAIGSLTIEEQIIAKIIENQYLSIQERERLKSLINTENIYSFCIKNGLKGKSILEVCQYIIDKEPIRHRK